MYRVAISDIHLSAYKDDYLDDNGLPYRLGTLVGVLNKICKFCKTNKIQHIDILGDLHNDKDLIFTDAQNAFKDIIVRNSDIHFTILSGNHDMSSLGKKQTSTVSAFEGYANVTCVTEPMTIGNITIIPWTSHIVENIKKSTPSDILLSHIGLSEGVLESGISMISDISIKNLTNFKLVLLGHYHTPQEIITDSVKVYYCGSPIHTSWRDKNQEKRFLVYDPDTLKVQSVPISGFVEYREYIIEDKNSCKEILLEAERARNEGHKVKVIKKFPDKIDMPSDLTVFEEKVVDPTNRGITVSMSRMEKMKKYLEIMDIPEDDREAYLEIGIKTLEGVVKT